MTRFIHTSDWQIGNYLSPETAAVLQQARLEAITTIGRLAGEHGAAAVLVAGDIYDLEGPSDRTLLQPIERMRVSRVPQAPQLGQAKGCRPFWWLSPTEFTIAYYAAGAGG